MEASSSTAHTDKPAVPYLLPINTDREVYRKAYDAHTGEPHSPSSPPPLGIPLTDAVKAAIPPSHWPKGSTLDSNGNTRVDEGPADTAPGTSASTPSTSRKSKRTAADAFDAADTEEGVQEDAQGHTEYRRKAKRARITNGPDTDRGITGRRSARRKR